MTLSFFFFFFFFFLSYSGLSGLSGLKSISETTTALLLPVDSLVRTCSALSPESVSGRNGAALSR
jgi:hypothetical protein